MAERWNCVANPAYRRNIDNWIDYGYGAIQGRNASPPVSLPDGFAACLQYQKVGGTVGGFIGQVNIPCTPGDTWTVSYWVYAPDGGTNYLGVRFLNGESNNNGAALNATSYGSMAAFERKEVTFVVPAGTAYIRPHGFCDSMSDSAYVTGWMIEKVASAGSYGDGDLGTGGWHYESGQDSSFSHTLGTVWTGSVVADAGAAATLHPTVALDLTATVDTGGVSGTVADMSFSTDGSTWSAWQTFAATASYTLPSTPAAYTVYARFRDSVGNVSPSYTDGITLGATTFSACTLVIDGGAASTDDNDVTLTIHAQDQLGDPPDEMRLGEGAADAFAPDSWGAWVPYATTYAYQLAAVTDEAVHARGVGVEFRNA